jgi:plastocyanin
VRKLNLVVHGRFLGAAILALALIAVAGLVSDGHARAASKYTVLAGGGRAGLAVEAFFPSNVFVNEGDTVDFTNPYEEIHTVTFLGKDEKAPDLVLPVGPPPKSGPPSLGFNPKVAAPTPGKTYDGSAYTNSGILNKGQTFSLTFPKQGTFPFLCVVHPGMVGTVQVLAPGVHVPDQKQLDYEATQRLSADVAKGEAAAAAARPGRNEVINVPSVGQVDIMRFLPTRLSVGVGETVTFKNDTPVPHTVTFTSGQAAPALTDAMGVLNPGVLFPARPSPNYEGTGYYNSGFLGTGPEATAGTTFSLTFTKPGTYSYICVLHADQGMAGVIQVGADGGAAAGGAAITPPSTGDAGLAGQRSLTPWLMGAGGVLALGFSALAIMSRRLRA